jgi:hypothetical protein
MKKKEEDRIQNTEDRRPRGEKEEYRRHNAGERIKSLGLVSKLDAVTLIAYS